ncbi:hypothetical protein [Actinomadura algeriensis]|uniref:TetR family transcriptional regulator n=1 Tax=Actinomadura algeriensis TaxID=1679523 RepID=A0ABR9JTL8_9ACTN|nr:hypothetical protein [Actinomadura algeriensis]MBE1533903.1 hypothetical protein [Actinomadura algeriensis]
MEEPQRTPTESPPAHQRRHLFRASTVREAARLSPMCAGLQESDIGAVFVSVDDAETARVFLDGGCAERFVSFYAPEHVHGLREFADLLAEFRERRGGPPVDGPAGTRARVAEVLAVGATQTLGVPAEVTAAARATALLLNEVLARAELPLPSEGPVPADDGPRPRPSRTGTDRNGPPLDDGTSLVSLECEQRIELLHEILELT